MFRALVLIAALFASHIAFAQESEPARYFKLDFVVKETDGTKVVNSRSYFTQISTARDAKNVSIRTGSKVPVVVDASGAINYMEVGANIDCERPRIDGGQLSLYVVADISSFLQEPQQDGGPGKITKPTIRQNRWSGNVLVTPKKPTVLFSSDDLTTKRQIQLELTAMEIK